MMNFRQIQAFAAIYEEGSVSRAARRENATQSGLSMQLRGLEDRLGVELFQRSATGMSPTPAGRRLYRRAAAILRSLAEAETELTALAGGPGGRIRVGLIPAFTHSLLAGVMARFLDRYPNVEVSILEAYSPTLTDRVARGDCDFAIVPAEAVRDGLNARQFGRDRELLVSARGSSLPHLAPVRLGDIEALRLVLPTRGNARRQRLEAYFAANEVAVAEILEMDAMTATLNFVAETDWMTILPATIFGREIDAAQHKLHPILSPPAEVAYLTIEPGRHALPPSADLFRKALREAFEDVHRDWVRLLAAADPAGGAAGVEETKRQQ